LLCDGQRIAPLLVATTSWELSRGLLGRDHVDGALILQPAFMVHTFGMQFPIDVAFCDGDLRVLAVRTLGRNRLTRPRIRSRSVIEASAGAFSGWGIAVGTVLGIAEDPY
jgi:uncharacterized membrane protein (UPF0127 family)